MNELKRCVGINLYDALGRESIQCARDGHFVEQGKGWCWQHRPSFVAKETREARRDRLETINTSLLEALILLMPSNVLQGDLTDYDDDECFNDFYRVSDVRQARTAIKDAKDYR